MNKLEMKTTDIVNENIKYIQDRFPNAIVETEKGFEVDFNTLKQEMSNIIADDTKEKYQLTWPGKKEAILLANTRTTKTLRPLKEKSVDFDNTENIYIEGDNLEALKILQESYLNKIKCIYIDPPYNTGNDFIYNDNFNKNTNEELEDSGQVDEEGNRLVTNTESNGRFHSDWMSMMYPRLKLARNLLADDGVIFISIDDNEESNLIKICDEIFDHTNYEHFIWKKKGGAGNTEKIIGCLTENILCFFKSKKPGVLNYKKIKREYKYNDEKGKYNLEGIEKTNLGGYSRPTMMFKIIDPKTGVSFKPSENMRWTLGKETIDNKIAENKIFFDYKKNKVYIKKYSEDYEFSQNVYYNLLTEFGSLSSAKEEINKLFGNRELFSTPKPTELIKHLISISTNKQSIILDFFAGSGTTIDACMKLNSEDGGSRKCILVQLPENCNESSEAYKSGYKTICDLSEERIRKAGKKIKEETNANIDYGFRVYKIDLSNMKDVYYKPNDLEQAQLNLFETNVKDDRTNEDLLTQVMLDLGLTLDLKIEEKTILDNEVYYVAENSLVACFDKNIDINIIDEICKCKPLKIVFKEECFNTDNLKINVQEKIKKLSPESEVYVL